MMKNDLWFQFIIIYVNWEMYIYIYRYIYIYIDIYIDMYIYIHSISSSFELADLQLCFGL